MSDPERIKQAVNEYTCNTLVLKVSSLSIICVFLRKKNLLLNVSSLSIIYVFLRKNGADFSFISIILEQFKNDK
jgi:hypothetical protein